MLTNRELGSVILRVKRLRAKGFVFVPCSTVVKVFDTLPRLLKESRDLRSLVRRRRIK